MKQHKIYIIIRILILFIYICKLAAFQWLFFIEAYIVIGQIVWMHTLICSVDYFLKICTRDNNWKLRKMFNCVLKYDEGERCSAQCTNALNFLKYYHRLNITITLLSLSLRFSVFTLSTIASACTLIVWIELKIIVVSMRDVLNFC